MIYRIIRQVSFHKNEMIITKEGFDSELGDILKSLNFLIFLESL